MGADIIEHLRIDRLRRPAQRKLAQGGQVGLGKKVVQRPAHLGGDINLAFLQALDQFVRRQIDNFDLGVFQYESGTVSRTRTRVNEATTSLRLSICWMLIVE